MRLFGLLLIACIGVSNTFGQNREILGEYAIGIVGRDSEDIIYHAAYEGAKSAALDLSREHSIDIELLVDTPDRRRDGSQPGSLANLFAAEADALIISPDDDPAVREALNFAKSEGQEVVFFQRQLSEQIALASLLADEREAGRLAAKEMLRLLPSTARIAILTSVNPSQEEQDRLAGVREVLGYRRIEAIVKTEADYQSAVQTIQETVNADRENLIRGWIFLEDWPLLGMPSLPWRPKEIPVVAIQSSPSAFLYLDQGFVQALVVHPYFEWGYKSVEIAVGKLTNGERPDRPVIRLTPRVVDWRNVDDYRDDWKEWLR